MTEETFSERLRCHHRPALVDFWALRYIPCRAIGSVVENFGAVYVGRVNLWKAVPLRLRTVYTAASDFLLFGVYLIS